MKARRQPAHNGIRLLAASLPLVLAFPVLAAIPAGKPGSAVNKHSRPQAKALSVTTQAVAKPTTAASKAAVEPMRQGRVTAAPQPIERVMPNEPSNADATPRAEVQLPAPPATAAVTPPVATAPENPYLAGWYRPVPAAALPAMAVGQLNYSARYVSDAVTSIPTKFANALPSIKTVHPTGGRDLVVANLKCPAEMIAGQYFIPANAMRERINGLFSKLNDSQLLDFDIQLVCS